MTNNNLPSHLAIALSSIQCFLDDGRLDEAELNKLLALAEADHHIDDDEARVLSSIMKQALDSGVDAAMTQRIQQVSEHILKRNG